MADPRDNSAQGGAPSTGNASTGGSGDGKAPTPVGMPDFSGGLPHSTDASGIGVLGDVSLQVRIELGRTKMLVEDVLKLNPDSVVELDKAAGDPVDIYVNGRRIARGEVLVLNENFCVRVSEILEPYESHA
ncbi:MAG: flagellar motor switch protein FliN [Phycisphaera sp.]|nr:flagellar motor switch protein FliN [Phycisphaera sp.]